MLTSYALNCLTRKVSLPGCPGGGTILDYVGINEKLLIDLLTKDSPRRTELWESVLRLASAKFEADLKLALGSRYKLSLSAMKHHVPAIWTSSTATSGTIQLSMPGYPVLNQLQLLQVWATAPGSITVQLESDDEVLWSTAVPIVAGANLLELAVLDFLSFPPLGYKLNWNSTVPMQLTSSGAISYSLVQRCSIFSLICEHADEFLYAWGMLVAGLLLEKSTISTGFTESARVKQPEKQDKVADYMAEYRQHLYAIVSRIEVCGPCYCENFKIGQKFVF